MVRPFLIIPMALLSLSLSSCGKKPNGIEPPPNATSLTVYPRPFPKQESIPGAGPQRSTVNNPATQPDKSDDTFDHPFTPENSADDIWQNEASPLVNPNEKEVEGILF